MAISYIYLLATEHKGRTINKIGWSAYPPERFRLEQIDESIKSHQVRLVKSWMVLGNTKHEQRLHKKFSDKRFTFKGSGKTEWFKLNWLELALVDIDLSICQWHAIHQAQIRVLSVALFLYIVFETIYHEALLFF